MHLVIYPEQVLQPSQGTQVKISSFPKNYNGQSVKQEELEL